MTNTGNDFAVKLDRLFEEKRKPDGTRYTQTDVVEGTKGVLTRVYLWKLRKGSATNPGLHVVQALADFFGVEPSYFFEGNEGKPQASKEEQKRDELMDRIAMRSVELDNEGKQAVLFMIETILKSKQ